MASVKRRPDGQWRARYRDEAGKEHARHFGRKVDAQKWIDEVTASVVTGAYVDPRAGKTPLRDYAARWEAAQIGRASTLSINDVSLRLHILPELGGRPLASIRRSDIQSLLKRMSTHLAPGTVRNVYDTMRRLFESAVDDRIIVENPCRRVTLPAPDRGEVVPPTVAEVERLASAVPGRYRAVVVLLAGSGLRIGELLGLRVTDVNFLRRELRVERQRLQDGTIAPPKTDESYRTVPLGRVVVDELASHLASYGHGSEFLFTTGTGAPLSYAAWVSVWKAAQRPALEDRRKHACPQCRAGVGDACTTSSGRRANVDHSQRDALARGGRSAVDSHALRHFYASCLISGGASVKQVSRLLGHASAVITLKVYAHLWPGDDERAREVVDSALSVLRTECGPDDHRENVVAGHGI